MKIKILAFMTAAARVVFQDNRVTSISRDG